MQTIAELLEIKARHRAMEAARARSPLRDVLLALALMAGVVALVLVMVMEQF